MDISIIIPMYNVEKYIGKCIASVQAQDWSNYNYEILIIDDESPDNSLNIAQDFQSKYPNIISIITQKNKGLGGARNTGIKKAMGKYLFFLDSDDFLINNELPNLVLLAKENNLDILEFSAQRVDVNYYEIDTIFHNSTSKICTSDDYLEQVNFANSACNKLYRRDFLIQNDIFFFEKTLIEDAPFNTEALTKAHRIMAIDKIAVAYLQNPQSITRSKKTVKKQIKMIEDSIKVIAHMANFQEFSNNLLAQNRIKSRISTFVSGLILQIIRADIDKCQKKKYISELTVLNLYPYYPKSNILLRDVFMKVINVPFVLKVILKIS